jgi:hypothetical protein
VHTLTGGGWAGWLGLAAVGLVLVLAPGLYAAAVVTHLRLRRRPDRYVAVVLAIPSAAAAAAALLIMQAMSGWGAYFTLWAAMVLHGVVTAGALAAVGLAGLAAGPAAGAAWWAADQWHRERAMVGGLASRRHRENTEARHRGERLRRAQEARHTRGRTRRGVGTGTAAGPYFGIVQADRGLRWGRTGRACQLPAAKVAHIVVAGASGAGKSELVHRLCEWTVEHTDAQVIYLNAKEPAPGDEPSRRLIAHAEAHGKTGRALIPGVAPYDGFRGTPAEVRQRLLSAEMWSEPFYKHGTTVLLALALGVLSATGRPAGQLADVLTLLCDRGQMQLLAATDPLAGDILAHVDERSWAGTVQRYASLALTMARWTGPRELGGWSFEDADVCCMDLPTSTEPDAAQALLRHVLKDLWGYLTGPARRPRGGDGRFRPLLVVLEELSALDADPVIGRSVVNAMERGRAARTRFVPVVQGPSGLGDDRTIDSVLTNATTISFRQISEAQRIAELAGTVTRLEASGTYAGHGLRGLDSGSAREQETYRVQPNELRALGTGEAYVIHHGAAARVSVGLPAGAFGVYPVPAWLDHAQPGPQLRPPVEPGQVPKPAPARDHQSPPVRTERQS